MAFETWSRIGVAASAVVAVWDHDDGEGDDHRPTTEVRVHRAQPTRVNAASLPARDSLERPSIETGTPPEIVIRSCWRVRSPKSATP